jgi:hypothetical protein
MLVSVSRNEVQAKTELGKALGLCLALVHCMHPTWCINNPKPDRFGIGAGTAGDIITMLLGWQHNPEGIPPLIRGKSDGMLNISNIDVCEKINDVFLYGFIGLSGCKLLDDE